MKISFNNMAPNDDKRELSRQCHWNAIVITLSMPKWRKSIEKECQKLSKAGLLPAHDMLLIVEDPQPCKSLFYSPGVGSGGATLNGILVVSERLSALAGFTMINPDVLQKNLILMIHLGRNSHHFIGGNTLMPFCVEQSWIPPSLRCPVLILLIQNAAWMATVLASKSTYGIWLTSVDFWIPFSSSVDIPDTTSVNGAVICSLGSNGELKFPYGIINSNSEGIIHSVTYVNPTNKKETSSGGNIVSGSTFISPSLAEAILSFHTLPPLDRCTYYGTDSATEPVQISLYFDVLLPLYHLTSELEYISGELSLNYAQIANFILTKKQEAERARYHMWKGLRGKYVAVEHSLRLHSFSYLYPSMNYNFAFKPCLDTLVDCDSNFAIQRLSSKVHSFRSMIDCIIKNGNENLYIFDSDIGSNFTLEADGECVMTNFHQLPHNGHLRLGRNLIWHMWPLNEGDSIITCHGFKDEVSADFDDNEDASVFNLPFKMFMSSLDLKSEDIWDDTRLERNLFNANIFPKGLTIEDQIAILGVLARTIEIGPDRDSFVKRYKLMRKISFRDILMTFDIESVLQNRDSTLLKLMRKQIIKSADHLTPNSLLPLFSYATAISEDASLSLLELLHEILMTSAIIASRLFANVADLLGCMAGPIGGLRSGPAANREWTPALNALKRGDHELGVELLHSICLSYIKSGRPENIIRASRHYERASHILISKQVETSNEKVFPMYRRFSGLRCLPEGMWVNAYCPARLDLAGGWTDTPPVCYEQGGAVLNLAIKVNGDKPIGAKARIISSLEIVCILKDVSGSELRHTWNNLEQLKDYDNPVSSGAIIKAVLIYSDFVSLNTEDTLQTQLKSRYNGGLELIVWSNLAQGSGLGGSSLIAGTLLGTLGILMGYPPPTVNQLIHATLGIEQMLTTGGGWQDQVGGLVGGMKLGVSDRGIPLEVKTYSIPISDQFLEFLNQRLLLIYTGKVRLARNLLQTVLRNWYAREENITRSFGDLRLLAFESAKAALQENAPSLGDCINRYWDLKKSVASGCEPAKVSQVMDHLKGNVSGQSLAGAGGGGYLYAITECPLHSSTIGQSLSHKFPSMELDAVSIDTQGLVIEVEGKIVSSSSCGIQMLSNSTLNILENSIYHNIQ